MIHLLTLSRTFPNGDKNQPYFWRRWDLLKLFDPISVAGMNRLFSNASTMITFTKLLFFKYWQWRHSSFEQLSLSRDVDRFFLFTWSATKRSFTQAALNSSWPRWWLILLSAFSLKEKSLRNYFSRKFNNRWRFSRASSYVRKLQSKTGK